MLRTTHLKNSQYSTVAHSICYICWYTKTCTGAFLKKNQMVIEFFTSSRQYKNADIANFVLALPPNGNQSNEVFKLEMYSSCTPWFSNFKFTNINWCNQRKSSNVRENIVNNDANIANFVCGKLECYYFTLWISSTNNQVIYIHWWRRFGRRRSTCGRFLAVWAPLSCELCPKYPAVR